MARALGLTPETATAPGLSSLAAPYLTGAVGLLFTNRAAKDVIAYFAGFTPQDFARAGQTANAEFVVPRGTVYATGGRVPPENDVPMPAVLEPELRRLGMPVRLVRGKIVLEGAEEGAGDGSEDGGYRICKEGEVLDSRQTRLLKLFDACMSEFRVRVVAYWSADTEKVTEVEGLRARNKAAGDEMEVEGNDEDDDDQ